MVSIWPTVDRASVNYEEMKERDLLIRTDRGLNVTMECFGMECFIDPTNPETREFVWQKAMENYRTLGVDLFWWMRLNRNTQFRILISTAITMVRH